MDEFWRRKEIMSENCPGGLEETPTTGGVGEKMEVMAKSAVAVESESTGSPVKPALLDDNQPGAAATRITKAAAAVKFNFNLGMPPPVIIHGQTGTEGSAVKQPVQPPPPPNRFQATGAQPGSPFHQAHQHQVVPHINYSAPPPNYMIPPPPFFHPGEMMAIPPPPIPPCPVEPMPQSQTAENLRDMLEDITKEFEAEGGNHAWPTKRNRTHSPQVPFLYHLEQSSYERKDF